MKARSEQFLGQMWFDAEVKRRAIAELPSVRKALADRRESVALDHWYMRNVVAAIDTSDANLKAHFAKDPSRFGIQAHSTVRNWAVPGRATADSAVAAIAAGAPWDSLCARFTRRAEERRQCASPTPVADDSPDTVLVAELAKLAPGQAYVRDEAAQGMSPAVAARTYELLAALDACVVLAEQRLPPALHGHPALVYELRRGAVVFSGEAAELRTAPGAARRPPRSGSRPAG